MNFSSSRRIFSTNGFFSTQWNLRESSWSSLRPARKNSPAVTRSWTNPSPIWRADRCLAHPSLIPGPHPIPTRVTRYILTLHTIHLKIKSIWRIGGNQRNQQRNGRDGRDRQWRDNNRGPRHHEDRNDSSRRHENSYREHRERERHRPQPYEHRGPRSGPS